MEWNPATYDTWRIWAEKREKDLPPDQLGPFRDAAWGVIEAMLTPLVSVPTKGSGISLALKVGKWLSRNRDPFRLVRERIGVMYSAFGPAPDGAHLPATRT